MATTSLKPASLNALLSGLPPIHPGDLREQIRRFLKISHGKIPIVVALDDDPTGTQTYCSQEADARPTEGRCYRRLRDFVRNWAAFVSGRLGISAILPSAPKGFASLSNDPDAVPSNGGLVIVGFYVPKTTAQPAALPSRAGDKLTTVELDVEKLLGGIASSDAEVKKALEIGDAEISPGQDVLVMTSSKLIVGKDGGESLDIGGTVARALVTFLERLEIHPRHIIAKGGITSSDMATKGLRMRRALVVGHVAAGVPLWRCDEPTSKLTSILCVVFPSNVRSPDTLHEVVERWRA